jgi:transcriptional regulator NrdR family protein
MSGYGAGRCQVCGAGTKVIDSRSIERGTVKRRRRCVECGARHTTYELLEGSRRPEDAAVGRRLAEVAARLAAMADAFGG